MVRQALPNLSEDGSHHTFALADAARLDVDVKSPSGELEFAPTLELFAPDGSVLHRKTGYSLYSDDLPPGPCRIEVQARDAGASWVGRLIAGRTERVALTLDPRGQIAVTTLASNPDPSGGLEVRVRSLETDDLGNPGFDRTLRLAADGTARVAVPIGAYVVECAGQRVSVRVAVGAIADATFMAR
jgi:hypothetical protein